MPVYAIRFWTGSGQTHTIREFACASDEAAVETTRYLDFSSLDQGFELWQGERLVAVFPRPKDKSEFSEAQGALRGSVTRRFLSPAISKQLV